MSKADPALPSWLEVILVAPPAQAEAAADFLYTISGNGVQVEELATPPGAVRVKGYIKVTAELPAQRKQLENYFEQLKAGLAEDDFRVHFSDLWEQDWGASWKKHFRPRRVTWNLIVAPPWEEAQPDVDQQVLIIDPGQAFGTGQHESTLLCLRRMDRLRRRDILPESVLDVGCGTGILALAGLIMGCRTARAIDLDPQAVEAAKHNAELNQLSGRLEVDDTPLAKLTGTWSLIVANLTAEDLKALAPLLAARLEKGGEIVASGLLLEQVDEVMAAFRREGLAMTEQDSMAGWASLVLV